MHREQVEAVVEDVLTRHFGDMQVLQNVRTVLQRTNANILPAGEADESVGKAGLIESLFITQTNVAKALAALAEATQHLQERISTLEKAMTTMQEATLNLQLRVRDLEAARPG